MKALPGSLLPGGEQPIQPGLPPVGGVAMNDAALGRPIQSREECTNIFRTVGLVRTSALLQGTEACLHGAVSAHPLD